MPSDAELVELETRRNELRDRWEEVRDKLDAAGVKYAGPDLGIEESMYFKDPDGIQIELLSDPLMYFGGKQLDE